MSLFIDDARTAKIVDNVKLPADAKKAIRAYAKLRKKADEGDRCAAAEFLGLSHQRIHQLAHE